MQIELTEQQARAVAVAARVGLNIHPSVTTDETPLTNPGDVSAAYRGIDILDAAWQKSTNTEEPNG